jgi:hypothetical protein
MRRCEQYARYTLPKVCLPEGYDQNSDELSHDDQSVGAQSVNHLANKIMLALFAPSRPFFRLDADASTEAEMVQLGVPTEKVVEQLAKAEKDAVKALEKLAIRPKLYEAIKHLIIVGNVLLCLEDEAQARIIGLKKYCVRRSMSGELLELLIADKVLFDELDPTVQAALLSHAKYQGDHQVVLYKWVRRNAVGDYEMEQWVDAHKLPKAFSGKWPAGKLPYRVLTWDLSDDAHYGTGLVEDYRADFGGLSTLSKSQIIGAVLSSEFRWLVNPAGLTKPEDFEQSENGAAIPGVKGDVELINNSKTGDLQVVMAMAGEYVTRIGRGFLLGSSQTRNAERVTAEEIRMVANELETALGGAYSRLAADFQLPLAYWLMSIIKLGVDGSGFTPSIVTGLEALSRTGDLEELKLWLGDMAAVSALPPGLQSVLKMKAIASALAAPRRISVDDFMKSDEQITAEQEQARQAEAQTAAMNAGVNAAAKDAMQPTE